MINLGCEIQGALLLRYLYAGASPTFLLLERSNPAQRPPQIVTAYISLTSADAVSPQLATADRLQCHDAACHRCSLVVSALEANRQTEAAPFRHADGRSRRPPSGSQMSAKGPGCVKTQWPRFLAQYLASEPRTKVLARRSSPQLVLRAAWDCVEDFAVCVFTQPRSGAAMRACATCGRCPTLCLLA